ncbi:MAG: M48 family metallopeptidase [Myxococcales bacterium]|nr:M48 family metallopeptidase [Myxococcales bacterium]
MSESIVIACRSCSKKNRLRVEQALADLAKPVCGSCRQNLFLPREEPLDAVKPHDVQHPQDRRALESLRQIPGVETMTRLLIKESYERSEIMRHYASYIRVSEAQLPDVFRLYRQAARRLHVEPLPDLFLVQSPQANAYTFGSSRPVIAVTSGMLELLAPEELAGVLAHELTHVKCDHVLFKTAARFIAFAGGNIAASTFGLSNLVLAPLRLALLEWDRCSELTADRGALLVTASIDVQNRTLMKLAGGSTAIYRQLSVEAFNEQVQALESMQNESWVNRLTGLIQTLERTHPFPVWRARFAREWAATPEFFQLLANNPPRIEVKVKPKSKRAADDDFITRAKRMLDK